MRVYGARETRPTALALEEALADVRSEWVLNWGRTMSPDGFTFPRGRTINPPAAVGSASNKLKMRQRFLVAGVHGPRVYDRAAAETVVSDEYPLIGRSTSHTRSNGLWVCRTREEVAAACCDRRTPATHFLEVIRATDLREYRVHIVNDKCIKISEKVLGLEGPGNSVGGVPIRSCDRGWVYRVPQTRRRRELRAAARGAVTALGLHLGAVDVLQDHDSKRTWVLEVNAAPGMSDESTTLRRYQSAIAEAWGGG